MCFINSILSRETKITTTEDGCKATKQHEVENKIDNQKQLQEELDRITHERESLSSQGTLTDVKEKIKNNFVVQFEINNKCTMSS